MRIVINIGLANFKLKYLLCFALVGLGLSNNTYSKSEELREVVFALKPDKNPDAMSAERKSFESFLIQALGRPVKVIVPLSSAVILEGLNGGSIDLAFLGSLDMLQAIDQKSASVLLGVEFDGQTSYESYWVSLKEKPYKGIQDLRGKSVAFASRTSTSGYLIPHAALIKKDLLKKHESPEKFFGKRNVWFGTGYVSAVEQVLRGEAQAAAVSDYVIKEDKHLSLDQKSKLKIVDRQGPVPTHVVAIRNAISKADQNRLLNSLKSLNDASNVSLRDKLFGSKLVEVQEDKHLAVTKEAIDLTGVLLGAKL